MAAKATAAPNMPRLVPALEAAPVKMAGLPVKVPVPWMVPLPAVLLAATVAKLVAAPAT